MELTERECYECGQMVWTDSEDTKFICTSCCEELSEAYYREKGMYDDGEYDNYPWDEYNP